MANILIVDDDPTIQLIAGELLRAEGHAVVNAADGVEALKALVAIPADLVVLDMLMPNMDGPSMVARARRARPDLPVLFMSGYAEEQLRKSIDIANVAFLPKPFSVSQLAEAARDAMAVRSPID